MDASGGLFWGGWCRVARRAAARWAAGRAGTAARTLRGTRGAAGGGRVVRGREARGGGWGGAQVENVAPNSPADRASLRRGDLIVGLGENPVRSTDDLLNLLDESAIGRNIELRVRRGKNELTLTVRPEEQPTE